MRNSADARATDGAGIHVPDCYIWAEIHYLDSPTDYREYLQETGRPELRDDDLVMLDSAPASKGGIAVFIVTALSLFALAGYFLFLVIGMIDAF